MTASLNQNPTLNYPDQTPYAAFLRVSQKILMPVVVLLALLAFDCSVQAQTAAFKSALTRVTVPRNFVGSIVVTNLITIGTNGVTPDGSGNVTVGDINLSVSGVPVTPSGLTFSITDPNSIPVPTIQGKLNTSGYKTNIWLTFNLSSVPEGVYPISFNANGGVTNNVFLTLQVGYVWNGGTNAALTGPGSWSDSSQWLGGGAPGATDDVILGDLGGQTNNLTGFSTGVTNLLTNVVVTANAAVASLRFSSSNSPTKFYNVQINSGFTLAVTGSNGFSMLKDSLNSINGSAAGMTTTFNGASGALVVSNETANINVFIDNAVANTLDLSGLGTFVSDVNRVGLADYSLWPYYRNLNDQNGFGGTPRQSLTTVSLARTNIIKSVYADPFNYTNADSRTYGFSWLKAAELSGTSTQPNFNLGISNIFYVDSALFVGANSQGKLQFNSVFAASNPICIFRGTNGGRMSVFTVSDGGATNTENSNMKSTITFQAGTLDMLVDRFYIGRDRKLILSPGGTPSYAGNFFMANGIVDANTVVLGYRQYEQTNALSYASLGYCQGTVFIVSNGVFKVNNTLTLGSTVATVANEQSTGGNTELGQVTVVNGGKLIANTVLVGGPVFAFSRNNFIVVSNSSTFVLSNTVGSTSQYLDSLNLANNSTNQLQIDGTHVGPYIYTTNLISSGAGGNVIRIASIKNLSFPAQVPLIQYNSGSHSGLSVVAPPGFAANLIDNGGGSTLDVTITTNQPKNLVWRAYQTSTWDNSAQNWLDTATGLHTNFANGDFVTFDDSPNGNNSTISLDGASSPIVSSGISMSNSTLPYVINTPGGGFIAGSVVLTKNGTNSLEIDAPTTALIQLNQGLLSGFNPGSIGGANVASGAIMNFAGAVNGGISCAGVATTLGTVNGALAVQTGGIVTNASILNGLFSTSPNSLLVNSGTINYVTGASTVVSNATLINFGAINGDLLTVNGSGTLEDEGGADFGMQLTTLTISPSQVLDISNNTAVVTNPGALFIPGGDGIGATWVYSSGIGTIPGRLSLFTGSTTIIKVDFSNPQTNTMIFAGRQDLGSSQTARALNGCTLVMTNINPGFGSFAAGQVFNIFGNSLASGGGDNMNATGTSTNAYPVMQPVIPGPGLAWDLSKLYLGGYIGIISVPTNGTTIGFMTTNMVANISILGFTTNSSVVTTNLATNNIILSTLNWPTNYIGWKLQQQINPVTIGLSTNWVTVLDSLFTNTISISNNVVASNTVFFRMTYP